MYNVMERPIRHISVTENILYDTKTYFLKFGELNFAFTLKYKDKYLILLLKYQAFVKYLYNCIICCTTILLKGKNNNLYYKYLH